MLAACARNQRDTIHALVAAEPQVTAQVIQHGGTLLAQFAEAGPKIQNWVAPSGAKVFFVETHALPILDVQVDFVAGTAYDPAGKSGVASLTRGLLDQGVEGLDETQIANRMADLGATFSGGADMDRASVGLRTLSAVDKRVPPSPYRTPRLQ